MKPFILHADLAYEYRDLQDQILGLASERFAHVMTLELDGHRSDRGRSGKVQSFSVSVTVGSLGIRSEVDGTMRAYLGTVAMGAGNQVIVHFDGTGLIGLVVEEAAVGALPGLHPDAYARALGSFYQMVNEWKYFRANQDENDGESGESLEVNRDDEVN